MVVYKSNTRCGNGHTFDREILVRSNGAVLPSTFNCPVCGDDELTDQRIRDPNGNIVFENGQWYEQPEIEKRCGNCGRKRVTYGQGAIDHTSRAIVEHWCSKKELHGITVIPSSRPWTLSDRTCPYWIRQKLEAN